MALECAELGNTEPIGKLVSFWRHRQEYERAEMLAQRAFDAGHDDILVELAWHHQEAGKQDAAIAWYRKAAAVENPDALVELARIQEAAGCHRDAEHLAIRAAEAGKPDALSDLVSIREDCGEPHVAENLARQAAASGHPEVLVELAEARELSSSGSVEFLYREAADAGGAWDSAMSVIWPHGLDPDGAPSQPWTLEAAP